LHVPTLQCGGTSRDISRSIGTSTGTILATTPVVTIPNNTTSFPVGSTLSFSITGASPSAPVYVGCYGSASGTGVTRLQSKAVLYQVNTTDASVNWGVTGNGLVAAGTLGSLNVQDVNLTYNGTTRMNITESVINVQNTVINMNSHGITGLTAATAASDAYNKNYVDTAVSGVLPTTSTADNGSFLQVLSGVWSKSGITGIPITNLNANTSMKSGCIYTFNNGTVTNPIPNGGSYPYAILVMAGGVDTGGVDDCTFIACNNQTPPQTFIHSKKSGQRIASTTWYSLAGVAAMVNDLDMGSKKITNCADPTSCYQELCQ
jgi:hypothetical protein